MNANSTQPTSRRRFIKTSSTAALGGALASQVAFPVVTSARPNSETLRVGLIGCGGRGTGAAVQALKADSNVELTAIGDLFEENVRQTLQILRKQAPDKVKVAPERCFLGFDAIHKVLASGVDVVLLTTPPGFRAHHLKAVVEAGKHAFVEITLGIDAPGVRMALAAAEHARQKRLAIVSGFCWRYNERHRGALAQIRAGAIGEIRAIYATYYRASLENKYPGPRQAGWTDLEWQIRNWHYYSWLSGDVMILLSGGHSVDKMSWWLGDVMPIKAVAVGGKQAPAGGNIFDHCAVAYEYANGVRGFLGCRTIDHCYTENADYIIGTKGICTIGRKPLPEITGETNWRYTGPLNDMYQTEHDELFASIRAGQPINDGTRMAHTTLMAVMGRMAAYTGQEITWEQALNSQEKLMPDHVDWNTKIELPPVPVPGRTKFV